MTTWHVCSKTQKVLAKRYALGARGHNENRFCNWLGTRGIGGSTIIQYLQRKNVTLGS